IYILRKHSRRSYYVIAIHYKLKWFLVCQFICMIPSTISRVYNIVNKQPNYILQVFQTIFGSISGVLFFIVYCYLPNVKVAYFQLCRRIFNKEDVSMEQSSTQILSETI